MNAEKNPLFTLTIEEFMALIKQTVKDSLSVLSKNKNTNDVFSEKEEHLTIGELARFLKCSKVSIHKYKKLGLPFYRIGRKVLFKKSEVVYFMKSRR